MASEYGMKTDAEGGLEFLLSREDIDKTRIIGQFKMMHEEVWFWGYFLEQTLFKRTYLFNSFTETVKLFRDSGGFWWPLKPIFGIKQE